MKAKIANTWEKNIAMLNPLIVARMEGDGAEKLCPLNHLALSDI